MPRVIAGSAGGIRLLAPVGRGTRPTPDRVKESLFSILGPRLPGARVLDLFAGTGQLAIEALSRGAASAVLVESGREPAEVIRHNLDRTGLSGKARLVRTDCRSALRVLAAEGCAFDLVFLDPPYAEAPRWFGQLAPVLLTGGLLAPGGLLVLEQEARNPASGSVMGLQSCRTCRYGTTMLSFYLAACAISSEER